MVRRLASCPSMPAGGLNGDGAYVLIVVDTLVGEVDAYGPMSLARARSGMQGLRTEFDADGAEFDGIVIGIVQLGLSDRRRTRS